MDFETLFKKRQQAIADHQAGRVDQACEAYRGLLDYEGDPALAKAGGADALTLGQFYSVVHNNLGAIDLAAGRYKPARSAFREALDLAPGNVEANTNLGLVHIYSGNPASAIDCFMRAIEVDPGYLTARFSLGKALNMDGQYEQAIESLDQGIAEFPEMAGFHAERAESLMRLSRIDEAKFSAAEAVRLSPESANVMATMGTVYWMSGELELAAESYRSSLSIRADDPGVQTNLATVLQKLDRFDEAVEGYHKALAIDPTFSDASGHLAHLYVSRNQVALARKAAAAGLKTKPGDPLMMYVLGRCDRIEGDLVAAKAQFLSLEPLLPAGQLLFELLHELAEIFEATGEPAEAAKCLNRAAQVGSQLPTAGERHPQGSSDIL